MEIFKQNTNSFHQTVTLTREGKLLLSEVWSGKVKNKYISLKILTDMVNYHRVYSVLPKPLLFNYKEVHKLNEPTIPK